MTLSLRTRAHLPVLALLVAAGSLAGCFTMGAMPSRASSGSASAQTQLVLVNNTRTPIYYVYISPCSASSWGADQLGSSVVMPGRTWTFTMPAGCYDLKAVDRDGREAERRQVRISGSGQRWTLS